MRILTLFFLLLIILPSCENESFNKADNQQDNYVIQSVKLKSKQDTIDYSLGIIIGKQMKNYGITKIDENILIHAINDVLNENENVLPIHPDVAKQIVSLYVRQTISQKKSVEINDNTDFLYNNLNNSDIVELSNGIQYKEIIKGTGKIPLKNSNVTVHYSGQLINGNVFVSTEGKKPVSFDINAAMTGWQEILTIMPQGSEWIVYLPPEYAFGQNGSKNVPPNSVVIYKINLLTIN